MFASVSMAQSRCLGNTGNWLLAWNPTVSSPSCKREQQFGAGAPGPELSGFFRGSGDSVRWAQALGV